jgi:hypothetical protein
MLPAHPRAQRRYPAAMLRDTKQGERHGTVFQEQAAKTFLGAPVGWPLMFLMAVDLCIAALMFLSDHDWSGLILLYPPLAFALAMLADARKEKQAAEEARRPARRPRN